jgi:hypothetical protein
MCRVMATRPTILNMLPDVSGVSSMASFICIILTYSHRLQRKVPGLPGLWKRLTFLIFRPTNGMTFRNVYLQGNALSFVMKLRLSWVFRRVRHLSHHILCFIIFSAAGYTRYFSNINRRFVRLYPILAFCHSCYAQCEREFSAVICRRWMSSK